MKIYISFGQQHAHVINGEVFDKDCLAEIECESHSDGRKIAFELFEDKFFTSYNYSEIEKDLKHFPRGIIKFNHVT